MDREEKRHPDFSRIITNDMIGKRKKKRNSTHILKHHENRDTKKREKKKISLQCKVHNTRS